MVGEWVGRLGRKRRFGLAGRLNGANMTSAAKAAVDGLLEAVLTSPDRNDLGRLARMHTCCQHLMEGGAGSNEPADQILCELARNLSLLLERLILDEAADPELGIGLVSELARAISQAAGGQPVNSTDLIARVRQAVGETTTDQMQQSRAPDAAASDAVPALPTAESAHLADQAPPPTPQPATQSESCFDRPPAGEVYVSEPLVLDLGEREHLVGFLDEAAEHMDVIEAGLLAVEADPSNTEKINELFRPFHTIKGIAGFLNLRDINRLTHEIETILDRGRKREMTITPVIVDLIFSGVDSLKSQLAAIRQYLGNPTGGPCPQPDISAVMARLREAVRSGSAAGPSGPESSGQESARWGAGGARTADRPESGTPGATEPEAEGAGWPSGEWGSGPQSKVATLLDQSIRVDTHKLDFLVDAVGELVIAQSMVSLAEAASGDEKLHRYVAQVSKIVRDVQETAMAMRMVPIGQVFQKMRRVVRDVSRKAGKQVELSISGEETELDKNVIQQISDPLVHMVRNAIDHGIEPPQVRRQVGKPPTGNIWLHAFHQGDSIVIQVRDDGRGLDRDKLLAKGIERGLVSPEEQLSDQQVFALILHSGFSTAETVTEISGRGVGMDVVRRNVEQLRGKIEIESEKGRGTTFSVRLPLTLAIIDGMLVRVGRERMIIPTILIEQSLRPERRQIATVQGRGAVLQVRGELCPLIQLGALFGYGPPIDPCENIVVILNGAGQKIALVLEELIGQQQVVIKTLGERFKQVQGVSGAAILGDGRVGLILEPAGLLALYRQRDGGRLHSRSDARPTEPSQDPLSSQQYRSGSGAGCPAEPVTVPV